MAPPFRALFFGLAAATLLLPGCSSSEGEETVPTKATSVLEGYWVWSKQVEDGVITTEITDADLEGKVGPAGWSHCTIGEFCTHYGVHKVAFGSNRRFHYMYNLSNESWDYQYTGSFSDEANLADYMIQERFSCSEPTQTSLEVINRNFEYFKQGEELWISVEGFFGVNMPFYLPPSGAPTKYIVFRQVSRDDYYGKYMIRLCKSGEDRITCFGNCVSTALVGETN